MTNYNFKNYSKLSKIRNEGDIRFDWCIFLDEELDVLNRVEYIKYILHPSFPNPERIILDRSNKFALYSNGWGEFDVQIEIRWVNREISRTNFYLKLREDDWPTKDVEIVEVSDDSATVYETIKESKFEWRKLSTVVSKSNLEPEVVLKSLQELENQNLIRRAHFKSNSDNQDLYGITNRVGISPE